MKDLAHKYVISMATCVIALVAIFSFVCNSRYNASQLNKIEEATKRQWRPYLYILHENINPNFCYVYEKKDDTQINIDSITITGLEYKGVNYLGYDIGFDFAFINMGSSPLRVLSHTTGAFSKGYLIDNLKESHYNLVEEIKNSPAYNIKYDVDVLIMPDSSFHRQGKKSVMKYLPIDEFNKSIEKNEINFYICSYVEYEDFFGNSYNSLLVSFLIFPIEVKNERVCISDTISKGIEKFRQDVFFK